MKKTVLLVASICFVGFGMMPGGASSHREAPLISQDPAVDNTDTYAFISPPDPSRVVLIANFNPLELPDAGPNFYRFAEEALYAIHVDNNGDAVEDVTFAFTFRTEVRDPTTFLYNTGEVTSTNDPDLNIRQFYSLNRIDGPLATGTDRLLSGRLPVAPPDIGPRSTPNYGGQAFSGSVNQVPEGNMRVFAGPRDEGFYVDLAVFDLLGVGSGAIKDGTSGLNVHTIAIEVPIAGLTNNRTVPTNPSDAAAVIGVWATAYRRATTTRTPSGDVHSGAAVQVSRLGMPLVNEVVIPLGLKDAFNRLHPTGDAVALPVVLDPILGRALTAVFGLSVPPPPRSDLVTIFLTGIPGLNQPPNVRPAEMLRLNVAIPPTTGSARSRLGILGGDVGGFPNGRRVGDDVFDIELRAVAGATPLTPAFNIAPNNTLGDGVDGNDMAYLDGFPFLAHPWPGNK